jgi:hypothetical protein
LVPVRNGYPVQPLIGRVRSHAGRRYFRSAKAAMDGCMRVYVTSRPALLMKSDKPQFGDGEDI